VPCCQDGCDLGGFGISGGTAGNAGADQGAAEFGQHVLKAGSVLVRYQGSAWRRVAMPRPPGHHEREDQDDEDDCREDLTSGGSKSVRSGKSATCKQRRMTLTAQLRLWRMVERQSRPGRCRAIRACGAPAAYSDVAAYELITVDPNRMSGLPCIRDTRVTVSAVLGQLAAGLTIPELLADFPYLDRADALAALEYAAAAVQERELPLAQSA
jgi:uncharacterized protein (DUF433 family)